MYTMIHATETINCPAHSDGKGEADNCNQGNKQKKYQ